MERQLLTAEKLSTIAAWLGSTADPGSILATWEPVLFNQTHDLASGVMTDLVYDDTIRSYEYAKRRSEELIDSRLGGPGVADRHARPGCGRRRVQSPGVDPLGHRRG